MADITITDTNVIKGSNANVEIGVLGATVAAGEIVYKDASDSDKFKLADADSATAEVRTGYGMALNGGVSGQPVQVLMTGDVALGAVLTAGEIYVLSSTPGKIAPKADLSAGEYVNIVGVATTTSNLSVIMKAFSVAA